MFMRMVQVKLKPETAKEVPELYASTIVPTLQRTPGCLHASLIRSVTRPDESISLTLWDSLEHADAYEQSGVFQTLLQQVAPYLADSSEWKIQLSKDFTWEYLPSVEEPVVKSYKVTTTADTSLAATQEVGALYVRIVSVRLKPGTIGEFRRLYSSEILPILHAVNGCRYAFLTEGIEEHDEVISVTVWDSKEAADVYETTGLFRKLTRKVQHTFSELYQWKMAMERNPGAQVTTSEDLTIGGYNLVSGKTFQ